MQSQALETLQQRLREAELTLRREQDNYRQMQVGANGRPVGVASALFTQKESANVCLTASRKVPG